MDPDASAFTILEMLRQLGHDPSGLRAALGSIYEQVIEGDPGAFDLWRDGQPFAAARCADEGCSFSYWDHGPRVDAFARQASMWAEMQIGPLRGAWPRRVAEAGAMRLVITRTATGPESAITIELWTNAP